MNTYALSGFEICLLLVSFLTAGTLQIILSCLGLVIGILTLVKLIQRHKVE